ncbi:MAG: hypothetical protein GY894_11780 [Planctomycetes bacterium]|jgi:uncharacterized membrane protein|nr:hypothetical protein [Planctomycetota bacterium]MCP4840018.1 hypothetical protein [Planctomycetota bacterium]
MTDGPTDTESACCSGHKKASCPGFKCLYAVLHIAILTCISMALWKTAWAIEALTEATAHTH